MTVPLNRELQTRVSDLEGALRGIRRIVEGSKVTPKSKLQQIQGILFMYPGLADETTAAPAVQS